MWAYVPCVADADNTKCRRGGERSECVPDGLEIFLNPSNLTSSSAVHVTARNSGTASPPSLSGIRICVTSAALSNKLLRPS